MIRGEGASPMLRVACHDFISAVAREPPMDRAQYSILSRRVGLTIPARSSVRLER